MSLRKAAHIVLALIVMCSCLACKPDTNILVIWSTDKTDPGVPKWNKELKRSLRSKSIAAHLDYFYCPNQGLLAAPVDLGRVLDSLDSQGCSTDIIVAQGDAGLHLIYDSHDKRLSTIPTVSFGAFFPTTEEIYRHKNVIVMKDTVEVQRNMALMRILWPETQSFVTDLDWTNYSDDAYLRNYLDFEMDRLGSRRFLNNVKLKYYNKQLKDSLAQNRNLLSLSVLSLWDPWVNVTPESKVRIYPQYAFSPASSGNRVIFYKNDKVSRRLTEDHTFMMFCTAVPQQFEVCDSCAGGFLAPMDLYLDKVTDNISTIRTRGLRDAALSQYVPKSFYLDWNVLRGKYRLEDIPSYVNIRNLTLKDKEPQTWNLLLNLLVIIVAITTAILVFLMSSVSPKRRSVEKNLARSAARSIMLMGEMNMMREVSGLRLWHVEGNTLVDDSMNVRVEISDEGLFGIDEFFRNKLREFFLTSNPGDYSMQIYGRSPITGKEGWEELRMHVAYGPGGLIRSGVTVNVDSQKKAEADVLETHRLLINAQERENFISSMSHEMRTPLNSIVGFSQIMTTPGLETTPEEREEMRRAVLNSGNELTSIINNMLALTRIENGAVRLDMKNVPVKALIEGVCSDMAEHAELNGMSIKLESGPCDCQIKADQMILATVLQNLVDNAIKYSSPGSVVTVGWTVRYDKMTVLYVSDTGKGISKENQELIFHRFYKADSFSPGVGLGLSLANEYVRLMGGRISVESKLGKGSTFRIMFLKNKKEAEK